MLRGIVCAMLLLATLVGQPLQAVAPPVRGFSKHVRFVSRAEALALALQAENASSTGDSSPLERKRTLNQRLLNVEVAYWNLYAAYGVLSSRERGMADAEVLFKWTKARYEAGQVKVAEVYQTGSQYALFRAQRVQAIKAVLESEGELRGLLGMPLLADSRLAPSDAPDVALHTLDWPAALHDALHRRPEILMARQGVETAKTLLMLAKLLHENRDSWWSPYRYLTTLLPEPKPERPTDSGWSRNLTFRADTAENLARYGRLGCKALVHLAQAMEIEKDQELKAQRFLGRWYEQVSVSHENLRANYAQLQAFGEQLKARTREVAAGPCAVDVFLEMQRFWADALANVYATAATYNNNLVEWEYARGTIQGELARVGTPEHERAATRRQVRYERKQTVETMPTGSTPLVAHSLPALWKCIPPLPEAVNHAHLMIECTEMGPSPTPTSKTPAQSSLDCWP